MACINQHFEAISRHVFDFEHMGHFRIHKMRVFQGLIRELQSQISHDVADTMHAIEDNDMLEFGKVRIEWEHYLNPDLPAFRDKRFNSAETTTEPPAKPNGLTEKTQQ